MKKEKLNLISALSETDLFSVLSEDELSSLSGGYCEIRRFAKGDTVFSDSNGEKCIGIILTGRATVKKEHIIISQLKSGDIFGAVTLYNKSEHFVNTIVAKTDCTTAFISKEGVEYLIESNSRFSKKYIEYLSDRIYFLNSKIKAYTTPEAENKLFNYLNGISDGGEVKLEIKMTELAGLLNLSRASLYRAFDELQTSGKIIKNGKNIILK